MKRALQIVAAAAVLGLLTAGVRNVENFYTLFPMAGTSLPLHPKYANALAMDSSSGGPAFGNSAGTAWRDVVHTTLGQPAIIKSGLYHDDAGTTTVTFSATDGQAYSVAPNCICQSQDSATALQCSASTTVLTFTGSVDGEDNYYICVGR